MAKLLRVIEIETDEDQRYCAAACQNRHDDDMESKCCGDLVEYERDESGAYRYRRTQACKHDSVVFPNVTEIPPGRLVAKAIWDYLCSLSGFGLESLAKDDQATWWAVMGTMAKFIIHGYYVARSAEESLNRQYDGELVSKYNYACESLHQYRAALGFDSDEVTREMVLERIRELVRLSKAASSGEASIVLDEHDHDLEIQIAEVINAASRENESNTPDFILAHMLVNCLKAYEKATKKNQEWHQPVAP